MIRVLFVCLGNICRSPAAEGILKHLVAQEGVKGIHIESAGLGSGYLGEPPDMRMCKVCKERGVVLEGKAKQFIPSFFDRFDYIFVADHSIYNSLKEIAYTKKNQSKIYFTTSFSVKYKNREVPDPYFSGDNAFCTVFDILEDSCIGILKKIKEDTLS